MTVQDLHTKAAPQPVAAAQLPWHLRKRFVLPVVTVLLVGAVSSITLLAGAVYTYLRVSAVAADLQKSLGGLGLAADASEGVAADPSVTTADAADVPATAGVGEVGEAGRITYLLEGDLDGVVATWVDDADGSTRSAKLSGTTQSLPFIVDGSWSTVAVEAHRVSGRGKLSCSLLGASGAVMDSMQDSGTSASVTCAL